MHDPKRIEEEARAEGLDPKMVKEEVEAHFAQLARNTTKARAKQMGLSCIENLKTLLKEPKVPLTAYPNLLKGKQVLLVGAGPSLDYDLPILKGNEDRFFIIAANTAYKALQYHQITPDAVATIEAIDCSSHLEGYEGPVFASLNSHPNAFKRATHFYAASSSTTAKLTRLLGSPPLAYGPSCTTSMVALAKALGASQIILLGYDLSYPHLSSEEPIPAYAKGAGWDGYRMQLNNDHTLILGLGRPDRDEIANQSNIPRVARTKQAVEVEHLPNTPTPLYSTWDLVQQIHYLEDYPNKAGILNATSQGALLNGYKSYSLAEIIKNSQPTNKQLPNLQPQNPQRTLATLQECYSQATRMLEVCDNLKQPLLSNILQGTGIVELIASPALISIKENKNQSPQVQVREIYNALRQASLEIQATIVPTQPKPTKSRIISP